MKVLITNSPFHYSHGHLGSQPDWVSLTLPYLAGCGGDNDYRIVNQQHAQFDLRAVAREFEPDIILYSIIASRDLYNSIEQIKQLRKWVVICGGMGASAHPDELLQAGAKHILRGEADLYIREILSEEVRMKPPRVIDCVCPPLHLDDCAMPRWDLMPLQKSAFFTGRYTGAIEMSRGCPHKCDFCAITNYFEGFKRKSNDRILHEIDALIDSGRTHIYCADDNFGAGKGYNDLFYKIIDRGLDIKLFAQMRTDTIANNPTRMELAKKAGLYGVLVGYDTYDDGIMHHVSKEGSAELNRKCAEVLRDLGVVSLGSHIFGLPSQKGVFDFWQTFKEGRRNSDIFRMPLFSLLPFSTKSVIMLTNEILKSKEGSDDYRLPMRAKGARRTFEHGCIFFNLVHIAIDWWKCFRFGMRGKFARADYRGAKQYWKGRALQWLGLKA